MPRKGETMTKKQVLACVLIAAVIIATLGGSFWWSKVRPQSGKATESTTEYGVKSSKGSKSNDDSKSGKAKEGKKSDSKKAKDGKSSKESAAAKSDIRNGIDFGEKNEEGKFVLPDSLKKEFKDEKRFNIEAVQTASVEALFPDRRFNWESYSKFTKLRKEASGGMSDAVAMPIEGADDEAKKQNWLYRMYGDPALMIGFMRMAANDFEFEDGSPLTDYLPDFKVAIDADDAAIERAKRWTVLNAEYGRLRNYPDDNTQKKACSKEMNNLEL